MNHRERLIAAINHVEPDRIPLDFGGTTVTGITTNANINLRKFLGLPTESIPRVAHLHQGLVWPEEDLLERYEIDFRTVCMPKSPRGTAVTVFEDGSFYDEYNMLWKPGMYDYCPVSAPLEEAGIKDLNTAVWPDPNDPARVAGISGLVDHYFNHTNYGVLADIMCRGPFELAVKLRGYERLMTDFYIDPEFVYALLEKITNTVITLWKNYLDAIDNRCHVVCQGDDLGMQSSLIISPDLYRQFIKPCHRKIYEFIHSKTNARLFMHSCGAIREIIPDLIEIGVNILNPVQRSAAGMDIAGLKKEFGKDIVFWGGGIDTQLFLPTASIPAIEDDIKKTIDIMAPGGGFVFAPTHNLQPDIAPDKIDAVYNTVLKYGGY
jgi:uroporphyrinogen decarboxylase